MFVKDVLDLCYSGYFFVYSNKKVPKLQRRQADLAKKKIKKQLIDSIINNDIIETGELDEKADKVKTVEDAAVIIKQYQDIIRT